MVIMPIVTFFCGSPLVIWDWLGPALAAQVTLKSEFWLFAAGYCLVTGLRRSCERLAEALIAGI